LTSGEYGVAKYFCNIFLYNFPSRCILGGMTRAQKSSRRTAVAAPPAEPHDEELRSRRRIMEALKIQGPQDASALAAQFGVSAMAIRQHLYALAERSLVVYQEEHRPMGRPAKLWKLTPAADKLFEDRHSDLMVNLFGAIRGTFGDEAMEKLLSVRARQQVAAYREQVSAKAPLRKRVEALVAIRSTEGYLAECKPQKDGSVLLIENHCPICAAATACAGLCNSELQVFRELLGPEVVIERTEHIVSGQRRCVYTVTPAQHAKLKVQN
jgi:predicted ArsR family transcriptional regulator